MIKTMKHNFFKIALVAAVVVTVGYGVYENQRQETMSDVMIENVEALAYCEVSSKYTGARPYTEGNRCFCFHCPEPDDSNCNCLRGD